MAMHDSMLKNLRAWQLYALQGDVPQSSGKCTAGQCTTTQWQMLCRALYHNLVANALQGIVLQPSVKRKRTAGHCTMTSGKMYCRAMYHNLVANAARLAKTEKDVGSIARVAAGEPQAVANASMLKGQKSGDIAAGLQGYVDKPRHAVG